MRMWRHSALALPQIMEEVATVNAPATCVSETQTQSCDDGTWSEWKGTDGNTECVVKAQYYRNSHRSSFLI